MLVEIRLVSFNFSPRMLAATLSSKQDMPKADDFITFLCFRNTPALAKDLEFFRNPSIDASTIPLRTESLLASESNTTTPVVAEKKLKGKVEVNEKKVEMGECLRALVFLVLNSIAIYL